ncbi:peroxidase-related enzyme [Acidobacteriia bacterium AH_259_A11_L15]|nr:peroxidase-related enzyme [Acidobacteriia bacterium AH_259_A11_L15]
MTFIPEVSEEQAGVELRQSYAQIREEFGFLPHFWQAQGSRPDVVRASLVLWHAIYRTDGALPPALKEEIGLVVSAANSDSYCIVAHLELLHRLGVDKALGRQLIRDYEAADVPEQNKALLRFAEKVTRTPFKIKAPDIAELRRHGWDDAAILEVCLVASHFNFLNRLAASLGLVPEHVF